MNTEADILSPEEKKRLLRTLEVDRELRYAIAGLIGLKEVLEKLGYVESRIREHSERIEYLTQKIEEYSRRIEEHSKTIKWLTQRIEEHSRRLEELSERIKELTKSVTETKVAIGSLGRRIGVDLEKLILNLYKDVVEKFGIDIKRIEKKSYKDVDGKYLYKGARIELDIYMSDNVAYFIEVKSLAEVDDVEWFNTKCSIMKNVLGIERVEKLIVAVNITRNALKRARELGVHVVYGSLVD